MKLIPKVGDMFRCDSCGLEIHVTNGCHCEIGCAEFLCCGEPMTDVTEPTVQESPDKIDDETLDQAYADGHPSQS